MAAAPDTELGKELASFPKVTVYERGLVAQQWGRRVTLPWEAVSSVYYHLSKETITLVLVPVAELNTRKLTLAAEDGAKIVVHGAPTEQVYGLAVAATAERRLARALDRLEAGETVSFGLLSISREELTYTVLRWIGPFPKVPWGRVCGVGVDEGWVWLSHRDSDSPNAPVGDRRRIAAAWAVDNLDVFLALAQSLARVDPDVDFFRNMLTKCPSCGGDLRPLVRICRHCRRRVSREEFLQQQPPETQDQLRRIDALFPAGVRSPCSGPAAPVQPRIGPAGSARAGKTCSRCNRSRTDTDLTCPHCGYTEWAVILTSFIFGSVLLLVALFWAPLIETGWLQGVVRWGGGGLGALLVVFMPFAAIKGLRAAGKVVPLDADAEPAAASPDAAGNKTGNRAREPEESTGGRASSPPPSDSDAAIPFNCPGCGRKLRVKVELAGKHGKCPGCNQRIQIPRKSRE